MAMSYVADLGQGQVVYLQNQARQTQITLSSATAEQQQRQTSGFTTGEWTAAPALFRMAAGAIVRIETVEGQSFIQLQSSGMQSLGQPPVLTNAEKIPLQQTADETSPSMPEMQPMKMEPMRPMKPMQPMKMGDMEMQMNPMQMRMGNMEMRMGEAASPPAAAKRFCTQCGSAVALEDKFCAHCGFQLRTV